MSRDRDDLYSDMVCWLFNTNQHIAEDEGSNVGMVRLAALGALEARIEKLNRKAVKLGLDPMVLSVIDTVEKTFKGRDRDGITDSWTLSFSKVRIDGQSPVIAGWKFVATLEGMPEGAGNLLHVSPFYGEGDLPEKYRTEKATCDHCGVNRMRRDTFVVKNIDTGEFKQVGRQCLKDFLGYNASPERMLSHASFMSGFGSLLSDAEDDCYGSCGGYVPDGFGIKTFLRVAAAAVRVQHGYTNRERAGDVWAATTGGAAWYSLMPKKGNPLCLGGSDEDGRIGVEDGDTELANEALWWAVVSMASKSHVSDYESNLLTLIRADWVDAKNAGLAASLLAVYLREKGQGFEKKEKVISQWVGEIKKRSEFLLTCVKKISFETMYGWMTINVYRDAVGNALVWKTASDIDGYREGDKIRVQATVKDHADYNGTQQTVLTRMKLIEVVKEEEAVEGDQKVAC